MTTEKLLAIAGPLVGAGEFEIAKALNEVYHDGIQEGIVRLSKGLAAK